MAFTSGKRLPATAVYYISRFTGALFSTMVFTASGIFAVTEAELNPLQLVLVGTALEASAFLFEVPTGVVADVYSRRLSIIIGNVLIGAGFILWGAFPLFVTILLAQVLWGLGYTFTSGAEEAWIADEVGEANVQAVYLRAAQANQLGTIAGIPIGVALATIQLNLPMVLGGVGILAQALFLVLAMPEHGFTPAPREDRSSWGQMGHTFAGGMREVRRRPALASILVIAVVFGAYSEAYDRLKDIHFIDDIGFPRFGGWEPVVWFGIMSMGGLLLSLGTTEIVRRRLKTSSHAATARALMLISALLAVSVVLFGMATGFGVALAAIWMGGVFRRMVVPLMAAWINQGLDPSVRATVLSMRGQSDAFGQIAGGPLLSVVATLVSVRAALLSAAAVLALTLPLYARTIRRHDPERTPAVAAPADGPVGG